MDLRVTVACGSCIGCRLDRQRDWAIRCVHETKLHAVSTFVTLTYAPEHLPPGGSLRPRDFTLFMKRLRSARPGQTIRFFQAGEYGEQLLRPHHHALLFGCDFPDKRRVPGTLEKGKPEWTSAELDRLWGHGTCRIGVVNTRTAEYTAQYVLKKINGDMAEAHYSRVDPNTGELVRLHPEYATMSRRPGLGAGFLERFFSDIFPDDFCATIDGKQVPVPPYYDKLLQRHDAELYEQIKARRLSFAQTPRERANGTPARLAVRAEVAKARIALRSKKL